MNPRFTLLSRFALILLAGSFLAASAQAAPDDLQGLKERLDRLEATHQKNNQDVANAMNLLSEMRLDLQRVKGQLESAQYLRNESDRVYQDLDTRVSSLEDRIQQLQAMVKELKPSTLETGNGAPVATQEYAEFQSALNLVNAQDYRAAAASLMGFMKKYPQSQQLGSAQYWLAESFYAMGDDARAIGEFQTLYEKYPTHPRVKEGIYKQGLSFLKLKKNPEAKLFFQKVIALDPNSAEALQAKARLARLEELEKSASGDTQPVEPTKPTTEAPVYRPIMKPSPMPGTKPPANRPPVKRTQS